VHYHHSQENLLLDTAVKRYLEYLCLSLDGASSNSHDALRGENSFQEVIEAANLCRLGGIPLAIKTVVTNLNKRELMEIAVLGATLKAKQHSFLALTPTLQAIEKEIIPSPEEMRGIHSFITGRLVPTIKTEIVLEGSWGIEEDLFCCNAYQQAYSVDHLDNLLFCCNLSHIFNGNKPATLGKEFLVDLKRESLKEGIIQHYRLLAQFTEAKLNNVFSGSLLSSFICWWCLGYFNKRDWIENYTESPWVKEIVP